MKDIMKTILLTIVHYAIDVIIWGSVIGFIYVLGHYLSNIFIGTNYDLIVSYFTGIVVYWVFDSILAKFRELYRMVIENAKEMENRKERKW